MFGVLGGLLFWAVGALLPQGVAPGHGSLPPDPLALLAQAPAGATNPLRQSYELYRAGQLEAAATLLEATLATYEAQGDTLRTGVTLSNLALVQGQRGQWQRAYGAVERAIALLENHSDPRSPLLVAQSWTILGQLHLAQGAGDRALAAFQAATHRYEDQGETAAIVQSRIRQAQALQYQGFYRRAITEILSPLGTWLGSQPDSLIKAAGLQSLGEALLVADNTQAAIATLEEGLAVLNRLPPGGAEADTLAAQRAALYINLGNVARSRQETATALGHYATAAASPGPHRLRAQLNQLSLWAEQPPSPQTQALSQDLWTTVQQQPLTPEALGDRINLAHSLIALQTACPAVNCPALAWGDIDTLLQDTRTQAHTLGDRRAESYALGLTGTAALRRQQWQTARELTEQALVLATTANATDMTYRWYEQLGEVFERRGQPQRAIAAYQSAVNTLKRLRTDLLAVNPDLQFSFQKSVEPIHRKLVSLLISTYEDSTGSAPAPAALLAARDVIESLQQEELNNYLRAACLDLQEVQLDDITQAQATAVIYPILLPDRLATIVSYPGQGSLAAKQGEGNGPTLDPSRNQNPDQGETQGRDQETLSLYPVTVDLTEMEATLRELRQSLTNRISLAYRTPAQQVYDWVIRPLEADLAARGIDTLVFVLDGGLRNVPMAALFDGEQFLIEKYAIALTPGLQLLAPQPLLDTDLSTLAFGLSEAVTVNIPTTTRQVQFSRLPNVETELEQIQTLLPRTQVLINQEFTPDSFRAALANTRAPIVHLATHGQFSSNQNETFIVAAGGRTITIDDLTTALEATAANRDAAVELLVLSACETAAGDDRAALGLAGIAVRAGARSTLASLWQVDDVATSQLMTQFYTVLTTDRVTKAAALRSAQLAILADPRYRRHPYFWAPFVLVGNWL